MTSRHSPVWSMLAVDVLDGQRAGLVVQDESGQIVDHNDAALELLEMTTDELLGRTSLDPRWEAVDAELRPLAGDQHPAMIALRERCSIDGAVMGVRVGDGDFRWLSIDCRVHETEHGMYVATQFLDVTSEFATRRRMNDALSRLQQHALPTTQLGVDWIVAANRYSSVTPPLEIGGDFLDVFEVDARRCGFFIGDVSGHDLDAVATMVIARHTLRAAGLHLQRPGRVLTWLHDTLRATPDTAYCTAVYGHLTPTGDGGVTVQMANAGHEPPIVVRTDGEVWVPDAHGALLGALSRFEEPPRVEFELQPGDQLLLFSDGLIESRRPRLAHHELVRLVAHRSIGGLDDTMSLIDELMDDASAQHLEAQDDTAVLVIQVPERVRSSV